MKEPWRVAVAVAGVLAVAAGANAQEPARTEGEQARERVEQQVGNVGEAGQVRTQEELERAARQQAGQPEGAGQVGQEARQRSRIYGEALMSGQERLQYEERMRSMQTEEARNRFQLEHRQAMQERARQQGKALDEHGNVIASGDELREQDRDRDRDRDQDRDEQGDQDMDRDRDRDRDRMQQHEPMTRPMPSPPMPSPGKGGGGRGGGG